MALGEALSGGQQVIQMPLPSGGVLSVTEPLGTGSIEDVFDIAPHHGGGVSLLGPDWLEHAEHVVDIDMIDPLRAQRVQIATLGEDALQSGD